MSSGLRFCEDSAAWDDFCRESREGSPFMESWFVEATSGTANRYFWCEAGKPAAAILIPTRNGASFRPKFSVHHSLCFSGEIGLLPPAERIRKHYELLAAMMPEVAGLDDGLCLSFHPGIVDMRPLQWHNFDDPQKGRFRIDVRYTAIRSLLNFETGADLIRDIRKDRRADFRKAAQVSVSSEPDIEAFLGLYEMTFQRQSIEVEAGTLSIVRNILQSIPGAGGMILTAMDPRGRPISATAILLGKRRAYSLLTANDPACRKLGANTRLVIEAMLRSRDAGMSDFDFVGANSPNRADYKLSFNAELTPYFEARFTQHE